MRFKIGDRIIHKTNPFSNGTNPSNRKVRHGVVKDIVYKINARGAKHPYITVQFDGSTRTETYLSSRIELEENKDAMLNSAVESVN
jgi:hypothetical protein